MLLCICSVNSRSQIMSQCGKDKKNGKQEAAKCVSDVLATF